MLLLMCGISKNGTNELIYKTERVKNKPTVTRGERRGGINWEIGTDIYILLHYTIYKIDNSHF